MGIVIPDPPRIKRSQPYQPAQSGIRSESPRPGNSLHDQSGKESHHQISEDGNPPARDIQVSRDAAQVTYQVKGKRRVIHIGEGGRSAVWLLAGNGVILA